MAFTGIEEDYLSEICDIVEETEALILTLEKDGFEAENFNKVMRNLHNLKGTCGVLELDHLSRVMHNLETFFLSKQDSISSSADFMLSSLSKIYDYLNDGDLKHLKEININESPEKKDKKQTEKSTRILRTGQEAFYKNNVDVSDLKVYHIDDEPLILELVKGDMESWGLEVNTFETLDSLRKAVIDEGLPDLFLIDYRLENITGLEILKSLNHLVPSVPKIIFSGFLNQELMYDALYNGAFGIIEKPFNLDLFKEYLKLVKRKKVRDIYLKKSHEFQLKIYNDLLNDSLDRSELLKHLEVLMEAGEGVGYKKGH